MLRVYACISGSMISGWCCVAGTICLLAAFTAFSIFEQARRAERRRRAWTALAGFVAGTGIWATHFIAMLAYRPNLPIGYDLPLTLLSIAAAVLVTGAGWAAALRSGALGTLAAGTVIGAGIGTMHYIGMAAVKLPGRFVWDEALVAASLADRHRAQRRRPRRAPPPAAGRCRGGRPCSSPSPFAASTSPPWRAARIFPDPRLGRARLGDRQRHAGLARGRRWRWSSSPSASWWCCSTAS